MADGDDDQTGLGLPSELLGKVFEFLPKQDRINAGLTCRAWRDVCLLPRFYRERSFFITGHCDYPNNEQQRLYMEAFGSHLHHLTISVDLRDVSLSESEEELRRVDLYYERLSNEVKELFKTTKLRTVNCQFLGQADVIEDGYREVMTALERMLTRQERLTGVVFRQHNKFTSHLQDYYEPILRALATPSTASHLKNVSFLNFNDDFATWPVFYELMGKLPAMETLGLSYNFMNDVVLHQTTSGSPLLRRVLLYIDSMDLVLRNYLPPTLDWQKTRQTLPELRVGMNIHILKYWKGDRACGLRDLTLLGLPLNIICLDVNTWYRSQPFSVKNIVNAISNVHRCISHHWALETFILNLPRSAKTPWNLAEPLATFVTACPALTLLCLQMEVTMNVVLKVAAAARPPAEKGDEEGGSSAPRALLATPKLQIHVSGFDRALEEVEERLSVISPLTIVRICRGCKFTAV